MLCTNKNNSCFLNPNTPFLFIFNFNTHFYLFFFLTKNSAILNTFLNNLYLSNTNFILDFFNFFLKNNDISLKKKIQIVRNKAHRRYRRLVNIFKFMLRRRKYLFYYRLKFNRIFRIKRLLNINTIKSFSSSRYPTLNFIHQFFLFYKKSLKQNWHFLTGGLISPYYRDLAPARPKIKNIKNLRFRKNYFLRKYKIKSFKLTRRSKLFLKKVYINNFFYANKINLNFSDLSFLVSLRTKYFLKRKKAKIIWPFSRPYLFLNNYYTGKIRYCFQNRTAHRLYNSYIRVFRLLKRKFPRSRKCQKPSFLATSFLSKYPLSFFLKKKRHVTNIRQKHAPLIKLPKIHYVTSLKKRNLLLLLKIKIKKRRQTKKVFKKIWLINLKKKFLYFKTRKPLSMLTFVFMHRFSQKQIWSKFFIVNKRNRRKFRRIKKLIILSSWLNNIKVTYKRPIFLKKNLSKRKIKLKNSKSVLTYFKSIRTFRRKNNFFNWINKYRTFFSKYKKNRKSFKLKPSLSVTRGFFFHPKGSKIFLRLRNAFFCSKERNPFLFFMGGFVYTTELLVGKPFRKLVYNLKKTLYSFSYKNEVQRYILRRYLRSRFFSLFSSNKKKFHHIKHSGILKNAYPSLSSESLSDELSSTFFQPQYISQISYILTSNLPSRKSIFWKSRLPYFKKLKRSDFNIRRIKFKPGYMSQWRDARSVLKVSLNLKMRYQYRLTRYLSKYNKFIKFKTFLVLEMQLLNILIKTRFIVDNNIAELFVTHGLIYVNGFICNNIYFQLFVNDFIQLIINAKYYILHKWFLNWSLKKKNRLRKIIRKKSAMTKSTEEKQRSRRLPKWILFSKNTLDDVSKYLEVDYYTLSAFILYEPFMWSDLNYYNILNTRYSVINLYNWKYIT